jgi:UMF1 family MFS transporter
MVVREQATPGYRFRVGDVAASWRQMARTIDDTRAVPGLGRFLLGRFFYSDAVNTVIVVMSVFAVRAIGLTEKQANLVLLLLTIVAVLASLGWGRLVDRIGPKRTLLIVLASWAVGLALGAASLSMPTFGTSVAVFLVAGAILGSGLGGVQVADRVLMIRLSPHAQLGEFFGLYGLVGKASQVVGQLLYGLVVATFLATLGALPISLFGTMLIGLCLVWPVSDRWAGADEGFAPTVAQPSEPITAS